MSPSPEPADPKTPPSPVAGAGVTNPNDVTFLAVGAGYKGWLQVWFSPRPPSTSWDKICVYTSDWTTDPADWFYAYNSAPQPGQAGIYTYYFRSLAVADGTFEARYLAYDPNRYTYTEILRTAIYDSYVVADNQESITHVDPNGRRRPTPPPARSA